MSTASNQKKRYLVSFYQGGVLKHQFRSLGIDHRDAIETTKKFLNEEGLLSWSEFDVVSEEKPLTIRLGEVGVEVCRVQLDELA